MRIVLYLTFACEQSPFRTAKWLVSLQVCLICFQTFYVFYLYYRVMYMPLLCSTKNMPFPGFEERKKTIAHNVESFFSAYETPDGRYRCPDCSRTFNTPCLQSRHRKYVCNRKKVFQCDICYRSFIKSESLLRHYKMLHNKTVVAC